MKYCHHRNLLSAPPSVPPLAAVFANETQSDYNHSLSLPLHQAEEQKEKVYWLAGRGECGREGWGLEGADASWGLFHAECGSV